MTSLACLALIIYHESRGESELTQRLVARVAIERSNHENVGICRSMHRPKSYSFMWDGKPERVDDKQAWDKALVIAGDELFESNMDNRMYFNECRLGKRFKTAYRMRRSGKLCFY